MSNDKQHNEKADNMLVENRLSCVKAVLTFLWILYASSGNPNGFLR